MTADAQKCLFSCPDGEFVLKTGVCAKSCASGAFMIVASPTNTEKLQY